MFLVELYKRVQAWSEMDRIGPDVPWTHWRLHFKRTMIELCQRKFAKFDETAEFRPGAYAVCCSKISIGKRVVIRVNSNLSADPDNEIIIEDDVLLAPGIHIYNNNHRFDNPGLPISQQGYREAKPVVLKKGCWIGANAIILPGVIIGENAVIGAGSVVTKTVPPRVVAVGNPARVIRQLGEVRDPT